MKPWASVFARLDDRSRKPRITGLTMLIDKGQGPQATADLLALGAEYIDHWKLSFGTSALLEEAQLRQKIAAVKEHGILIYPGGTLMEYALVRGKCREFFARARALGFNAVEISDGTIHLPARDRVELIRIARDLDLAVITEVGKKDPRRQPQARVLAEVAQADLEAGAAWVIVEARESGKGVGVYDSLGRVTEQDVDTIVINLDRHLGRLIWEAPLKGQQEYLILRFGPDVSLGNIQPHDLLALEALRAGLRFETLKPLVEQMEREGILEIPSLSARVARMARRGLPEA